MKEHDFYRQLQESLNLFVKSYKPFYNDLADYNTNSASYYDYLAKFNKLLVIMTNYINILMLRRVKVEDSSTIDLDIVKDWVNCYEFCQQKDINPNTVLTGKVKFSNETITKTMNRKTFTLNNATYDNVGVFTPNVNDILNEFDKEIGKNITDIQNHYNEFKQYKTENDIINNNQNEEIENNSNKIENNSNKIEEIEKKVVILTEEKNTLKSKLSQLENDNNILKRALQKILNNLNENGIISNSNMNTFNFNYHLAYGNINVFTKGLDSNYFIKTHNETRDNDITLGV